MLFRTCIGALAAASLFSAPILSLPPGVTGTVTTWATGLNYPTGMVQLSDGSILVGTTVPRAAAGPNIGYYEGTGSIMRIASPGAAPTPVSGSIPGAVTSLAQMGNALLVGTTGHGAGTIPQGEVAPTSFFDIRVMVPNGGVYQQIGAIHVSQTQGFVNAAFTVEPGANAGEFVLYFQVGAAVYQSNPLATVPISGLVTGTVQQGAIYRVPLTLNGNTVTAGSPTQIATGIRNSFGMVLDSSGRLIFGDNGAENDFRIANSLDTLNVIPFASTTAAVLDFGYDTSYYDSATGLLVNGYAGRQLPLAVFPGPQPPSGISNLALAPVTFPAAFQNKVFTAFHGNYFQANAANLDNPLKYCDTTTGVCQNLVNPGQAGVGNLDGLLATIDSLFVSDFQVGPGTFVPGTGAVYQFQFTNSIPEPATWALLLPALALIRRRRAR